MKKLILIFFDLPSNTPGLGTLIIDGFSFTIPSPARVKRTNIRCNKVENSVINDSYCKHNRGKTKLTLNLLDIAIVMKFGGHGTGDLLIIRRDDLKAGKQKGGKAENTYYRKHHRELCSTRIDE